MDRSTQHAIKLIAAILTLAALLLAAHLVDGITKRNDAATARVQRICSQQPDSQAELDRIRAECAAAGGVN